MRHPRRRRNESSRRVMGEGSDIKVRPSHLRLVPDLPPERCTDCGESTEECTCPPYSIHNPYVPKGHA